MKVSVTNLRRDECQLTGRIAQCVDVKSHDLDSLAVTVCLKKLPELISNIDFQTILKAATSTEGVNKRLREVAATS